MKIVLLVIKGMQIRYQKQYQNSDAYDFHLRSRQQIFILITFRVAFQSINMVSKVLGR